MLKRRRISWIRSIFHSASAQSASISLGFHKAPLEALGPFPPAVFSKKRRAHQTPLLRSDGLAFPRQGHSTNQFRLPVRPDRSACRERLCRKKSAAGRFHPATYLSAQPSREKDDRRY